MKKLYLLMISTILFANQNIGHLIFKKGLVKVQHPHNIRKYSLRINDNIQNGDKISTYNSIATIELNDKSIIKLDKYSTIKFNDDKFKQETGKIYYQITKRKLHPLKVSTLFTTIGVKGTIFIVDTKHPQVALQKGLISLTAPKGKYEIHKTKILDEYDSFKKSMNQGFESYKEILYKEFISYKKSFDLKQNFMVTFDGNKAYEKKLNPKEFNYFQNNFK